MKGIQQHSSAATSMKGIQQEVTPNMRSILIDWLVEVQVRFKLIPETMQLTVNVLDRYLSIERIAKSKLQLVGVVAMLIASKYEEKWPPEVRDFMWVADNAYSQKMLRVLGSYLSKKQFAKAHKKQTR